jgi:hypothetical protein
LTLFYFLLYENFAQPGVFLRRWLAVEERKYAPDDSQKGDATLVPAMTTFPENVARRMVCSNSSYSSMIYGRPVPENENQIKTVDEQCRWAEVTRETHETD